MVLPPLGPDTTSVAAAAAVGHEGRLLHHKLFPHRPRRQRITPVHSLNTHDSHKQTPNNMQSVTAQQQRTGEKSNGEMGAVSLLFDFMRSTPPSTPPSSSLAWHAIRDWKKKKTKKRGRAEGASKGKRGEGEAVKVTTIRLLMVSHSKNVPFNTLLIVNNTRKTHIFHPFKAFLCICGLAISML